MYIYGFSETLVSYHNPEHRNLNGFCIRILFVFLVL
jgi:hypothetical protein